MRILTHTKGPDKEIWTQGVLLVDPLSRKVASAFSGYGFVNDDCRPSVAFHYKNSIISGGSTSDFVEVLRMLDVVEGNRTVMSDYPVNSLVACLYSQTNLLYSSRNLCLGLTLRDIKFREAGPPLANSSGFFELNRDQISFNLSYQ